MITLYIVLGIIILATIVWAIYDAESMALVSLIVSLPFGLLVTMLIGIAVSGFVPEQTSEKSSNIKSISDGTQVSGSFFLGSGSISDEPVYFYYYEVAPGAYKQGYVPADKTTILEKTDATPQIKTVFECPTETERHWNVLANDRRDIVCDDISYEFIVPNGTIVPNYILDTSAK